MVSQKYRWDFIGLSTDDKPTSETSDKVVNGSTYYCSDTSKLYVYCDGTWYERKPLGGGGGTSDFNDLSNRPKYNGTDMTGSTNIPEVVTYSDFTGTDGTAAGTAGLVPAPATTDAGKFLKADGTWDTAGGGATYTAGDGIDITNAVISATNTGKARELTTADYNWHSTGDVDDSIAAWLLPDGLYVVKDSPVVWFTTSYNDSGLTFIKGTNSVGIPYLLTINNAGGVAQYTLRSNGSTMNERPILKQTDIINNLTSTSTTAPLSANQGKVLKDLVDSLAIRAAGAPTTSTVGSVGTLYEDTTNGDLYICTDATNPYVWEEVGAGGSGPTVVQTTGTSTTDVMSQNAVTSMVFADPSTKRRVQIGSNSSTGDDYSIALGSSASTTGLRAVAVGNSATASATGAVAIGMGASASTQGEMNIGSRYTTYGYNSSNYRLLTGLYDGQSAHDAATVAQGNTLSTSAPTTSTVGVLGQLYTDTTNLHTYQCTAISGDTYTWTQRW